MTNDETQKDRATEMRRCLGPLVFMLSVRQYARLTHACWYSYTHSSHPVHGLLGYLHVVPLEPHIKQVNVMYVRSRYDTNRYEPIRSAHADVSKHESKTIWLELVRT